MQQYALERLEAAGELEATRSKHLRWYSRLGVSAEADSFSARLLPLFDRLDGRRDPHRRTGCLDRRICPRRAGLTALPIAVGIAILRSRLFDIDVIIGNTLTYAMLTDFVAGLYGGVTTVVQRLSVLMTGQQSDSTLVIAAVVAAITFTPVKNSLQAVVDRRFKSAIVPQDGAAIPASLAQLSAEVARLRARVDRLQATSLVTGKRRLVKSTRTFS